MVDVVGVATGERLEELDALLDEQAVDAGEEPQAGGRVVREHRLRHGCAHAALLVPGGGRVPGVVQRRGGRAGLGVRRARVAHLRVRHRRRGGVREAAEARETTITPRRK